MRNNTKLRLRWGDFLIFLAIVVAACGIWIHLAMLQTDQTYGEIWVDGELYRQFRLDGSVQKTAPDYPPVSLTHLTRFAL